MEVFNCFNNKITPYKQPILCLISLAVSISSFALAIIVFLASNGFIHFAPLAFGSTGYIVGFATSFIFLIITSLLVPYSKILNKKDFSSPQMAHGRDVSQEVGSAKKIIERQVEAEAQEKKGVIVEEKKVKEIKKEVKEEKIEVKTIMELNKNDIGKIAEKELKGLQKPVENSGASFSISQKNSSIQPLSDKGKELLNFLYKQEDGKKIEYLYMKIFSEGMECTVEEANAKILTDLKLSSNKPRKFISNLDDQKIKKVIDKVHELYIDINEIENDILALPKEAIFLRILLKCRKANLIIRDKPLFDVKNDIVIPVCNEGLNRSTASAAILKLIHPDLEVPFSHGVIFGFDPVFLDEIVNSMEDSCFFQWFLKLEDNLVCRDQKIDLKLPSNSIGYALSFGKFKPIKFMENKFDEELAFFIEIFNTRVKISRCVDLNTYIDSNLEENLSEVSLIEIFSEFYVSKNIPRLDFKLKFLVKQNSNYFGRDIEELRNYFLEKIQEECKKMSENFKKALKDYQQTSKKSIYFFPVTKEANEILPLKLGNIPNVFVIQSKDFVDSFNYSSINKVMNSCEKFTDEFISYYLSGNLKK